MRGVKLTIEVSGRPKSFKSTVAKEIQHALLHLGFSAVIEDDSTWAHAAEDSGRFERLSSLRKAAPDVVIRSRTVLPSGKGRR